MSAVAEIQQNHSSRCISTDNGISDVRPSLKSNIRWILVANLVFAASQWGILVVLAKLGSPEMVGQFVLGITISAPIFMFMGLDLRVVQVTDTKKRFELQDYIGLGLLTTLISLFFIIIIVRTGSYRDSTLFAIILISLTKAVDSLSEVLHGYLHKQESMQLIARSRFIKGALSLSTFACLVSITGSLAVGVASLLLVSCIVYACVDLPNVISLVPHQQFKALLPRWNFSVLMSLAWVALPAGLSTGLMSMGVNLPRFFIGYELGVKDLGIFAALTYTLIVGDLIMRSVRQAALPRLAHYYNNRNYSDFKQLLAKISSFGLLMGLAGILIASMLGVAIIDLLYGVEYTKKIDVLLWLMIANAVRMVTISPGALRTMNLYWFDFIIRTISIGLLTASCAALIPPFGLLGAAYAILIASSASAIMCTTVVLVQLRRMSRLSQLH